MNKVSVDFENCYGIKALNYQFDTTNGRAFLIYAPNGSMKTSFAKVFRDVSRGQNPSDMIFPIREFKFLLQDETGNNIPSNQIFVVEPYQEGFNATRTATLLVNQGLRQLYEKAIRSINEEVDQITKKLGEVAHLKKGVIPEIALAFGMDEKDILSILESIASILQYEENPGFENIVYSEVFNEKVLSFLSSSEIRQQLREYVERYNELIDKSTYFKKGLFDHNNAANVCKSLQDNGFFKAKHTVLFAGQNSTKIEISTQKELDELIASEKQQIINDPQLINKFEAIDKAITRNNELRQFRRYIEDKPEILPELLDLVTLRRKLWKSYSFAAIKEFTSFLSTYQSAKEEIAKVIETAKKEKTEWQEVVSIFHDRFTVPFSLEISNQDDVILKNETPSLIFRYKDGDDIREIGREDLINVLSTGERRALYLLNIIFELQSLRKEPENTILVLDDIADSFDYKNKYAIIEYVNSILDTGKFIIIVLTHNFDFYRTIQMRLGISRRNCLMVIKTDEKIVLTKAEYLKPFEYWRGIL